MRQMVLLAFGIILAVCGPSSGQLLGTGIIPTFETSPMQQNATITAFQSTVTAVESVIQSGFMLLELTPIDDVVLSGEFIETLAILGEIASEGAALMQDAEAASAQFSTLFSIERELPSTPYALQTKIDETSLFLAEARRYALCTQSLIHSIHGAVTHVQRIVQLVGILTGNMQGNQLMIQLQAQTNQMLATQTLQQAAAQRIQVFEGAQRELIIRSLANMQAARWADWPALSGGLN